MPSHSSSPTRRLRDDDGHVSTISSMSYETTSSVSNSTNYAECSRQEMSLDKAELLRVINAYRSEHGAGPLRWSSTCARRAQARANHHAGPATDYGENLARSTDPCWGDASAAGIAAIHHWQKEEARYRYDKPGLTSKTNRFTNNVWKLTTDVGFGMGRAKYKGVLTFFVVAYFFPKGNEPSDFARNVLRKGSVYDGDEHMVRLAAEARAEASAPPLYVRVSTISTEVREVCSANGRFCFEILPDRNIVVREGKSVRWESGSRPTQQPPVSSPFRLVLQKNGDLVAYDASSRAFWSSDTANCGPAPYTLSMQDDGHCVLYDGGWVPRWATSANLKKGT
ncbi:unnamed protein product [Laminaria digitata]